jgi:hypothetical protein
MPPSPNGPKTEMGFVTVNAATRKRTDELAGQWGDVSHRDEKSQVEAPCRITKLTVAFLCISFPCSFPSLFSKWPLPVSM